MYTINVVLVYYPMFKSEIIFIKKIEKFNAMEAGKIDKHAKWNYTNTISTREYVIRDKFVHDYIEQM